MYKLKYEDRRYIPRYALQIIPFLLTLTSWTSKFCIVGIFGQRPGCVTCPKETSDNTKNTNRTQ